MRIHIFFYILITVALLLSELSTRLFMQSITKDKTQYSVFSLTFSPFAVIFLRTKVWNIGIKCSLL